MGSTQWDLNFFIPDLTKYDYLDDDEITDKQQAELDAGVKYLNETLSTILKEQFYLVYNGNGFTIDSIENMSVPDREWFFNKLNNTIKEENEAQKKAMEGH